MLNQSTKLGNTRVNQIMYYGRERLEGGTYKCKAAPKKKKKNRYNLLPREIDKV